jgi:hypothetical protein
MYLIFGEAVLARSSNSVILFKKQKEDGKWTQYYKIDKMRGTIYFMRGNVRFQITTEERVYFYLISRETLEPQLENVMFNYMGCSNLLFGARVRYGIAFKASEQGIQVYRRRLYHNFKVCLHQEPSGEAVCDELRSLKQFIVGR